MTEQTKRQQGPIPLFTPGPWAIEDHSNGCLFVTNMQGDICDLYFEQHFHDGTVISRFNNAPANAALIAAAPELYEALELMQRAYIGAWTNDQDDLRDKAHALADAALTKARLEEK